MTPLVSVIVPVYNSEKYLDHCLSSLTHQTLQNIEIILIDDGSSDHSDEICNRWKERDSRIQVFHQENLGGGNARNKALDIARGIYISFVDSDDFVSKDMLNFLYKQFMPDIDIVECGFYLTTNDKECFDRESDKFYSYHYSPKQAMLENIRDHYFRQVIWNKMYRHSIIKNIRFPEGKTIDDEFWTYRAIGQANGLIHTNKKLYAYRQQNDSVMHSIDVKKRMEAIEAKVNRHIYICQYMPQLKDESAYNLLTSCLYQGQLICHLKDKNEMEILFCKLEKVLKKYPIENKGMIPSYQQRIWEKMTRISFKQTCKLRNWLKIGI